jgi:hypothetical protein
VKISQVVETEGEVCGREIVFCCVFIAEKTIVGNYSRNALEVGESWLIRIITTFSLDS